MSSNCNSGSTVFLKLTKCERKNKQKRKRKIASVATDYLKKTGAFEMNYNISDNPSSSSKKYNSMANQAYENNRELKVEITNQ